MIVLDTTVLVYALGLEHPLRDSARRVVSTVADGLAASTTPEVIQEFAHVFARRRDRAAAASHARRYVTLLAPLLETTQAEVESALRLFERSQLGAFDALLAATSIAAGATALVSADTAFSGIRRLPFVELGSDDLERLLV